MTAKTKTKLLKFDETSQHDNRLRFILNISQTCCYMEPRNFPSLPRHWFHQIFSWFALSKRPSPHPVSSLKCSVGGVKGREADQRQQNGLFSCSWQFQVRTKDFFGILIGKKLNSKKKNKSCCTRFFPFWSRSQP